MTWPVSSSPQKIRKDSERGLNLTYSVIVTKRHGRIGIETAPSQGVRFTLHLSLQTLPEGGIRNRTEGSRSWPNTHAIDLIAH